MTEQYDELPFTTAEDDWPPAVVMEREPRPCRRHEWNHATGPVTQTSNGLPYGSTVVVSCRRCGRVKDEAGGPPRGG